MNKWLCHNLVIAAMHNLLAVNVANGIGGNQQWGGMNKSNVVAKNQVFNVHIVHIGLNKKETWVYMLENTIWKKTLIKIIKQNIEKLLCYEFSFYRKLCDFYRKIKDMIRDNYKNSSFFDFDFFKNAFLKRKWVKNDITADAHNVSALGTI